MTCFRGCSAPWEWVLMGEKPTPPLPTTTELPNGWQLQSLEFLCVVLADTVTSLSVAPLIFPEVLLQSKAALKVRAGGASGEGGKGEGREQQAELGCHHHQSPPSWRKALRHPTQGAEWEGSCFSEPCCPDHFWSLAEALSAWGLGPQNSPPVDGSALCNLCDSPVPGPRVSGRSPTQLVCKQVPPPLLFS